MLINKSCINKDYDDLFESTFEWYTIIKYKMDILNENICMIEYLINNKKHGF